MFPLLLTLIFGIVQAALFFHARTVALAAAQEGVRVIRVEDGTPAAGRTAALDFLAKAGGSGVLSGVEVQPYRGPGQARVVVSGTAPSVLPVWDGPVIRQEAAAPVERITGP